MNCTDRGREGGMGGNKGGREGGRGRPSGKLEFQLCRMKDSFKKKMFSI